MKRLLFYATRADLLPIMAAVERSTPLLYVRMGHHDNERAKRFHRAEDLPDLGNATRDSAATSEEYIVTVATDQILTRSVRASGGSELHLVDQLANPRSITFAPGGIWNDEVLLHGRFATVSDTNESKQLLRKFERELRRSFHKVKAFWVGHQAIELLRSGKRLTISVQSPREFDLVE